MTRPATTGPARLPSLIAPHYFSGQLLSDADLDALVGWTQARLSLGGRETAPESSPVSSCVSTRGAVTKPI